MEQILLPLLLQLTVIILTARLFAVLFRYLRQPGVVGELFAGLVLGPSVLGKLFPGLFAAIFHPTTLVGQQGVSDQIVGWCFTSLSQIGLIFLLFLIGLEFDFGHLRWQGRSALAISLAGIVAPFTLGFALAWGIHPSVAEDIPRSAFALFLGTTLAITAMPVLGRIMIELNITRTRLGLVTMSAAAADDAVGWVLLAAVTAFARAQFEATTIVLIATKLLIFALAMIFVVRPLLCRWARWSADGVSSQIQRVGSELPASAAESLQSEGSATAQEPDGSSPGPTAMHQGEMSLNALAILLALIFGCALTAQAIGLFAVFGSFLLGVILSGQRDFRAAVSRRLRDFVTAFFLPIFFTYTGLRTDIGSLESVQLWGWCALVTATATIGKFGGCGMAAWLTGYSPRESACIGVLMNTRALMALIVINIGKDLGVIPDSMFCMLVLMALFTTVMTTPVLLRVMRGTELEPYINRSGFVS
ncbi:MAG TPA: cation:proton antiporter [Gemmataceae bacterium]|nr:cation:proton antiporter [Gemmataceae bacterium]